MMMMVPEGGRGRLQCRMMQRCRLHGKWSIIQRVGLMMPPWWNGEMIYDGYML